MFSHLPVSYQYYYPAADNGLRFPQDENNEGAQVSSVTNGKTDTIKSNASPEPAVAELHPDLDNQESIASVDEQGNEGREENEGRDGFEAERDKCQLGIILDRWPFSKVRSLYECSKAYFDDDDPVYLFTIIPEYSIVEGSIIPLPETADFKKLQSSSRNQTNALTYAEFNKYFYLLIAIQKKRPLEDSNALNNQASCGESNLQELHDAQVANAPDRDRKTRRRDREDRRDREEWIDLLADRKVRISTIKEQFDGMKNQTVKLVLRLLPNKNTTGLEYSNQLVEVKLEFKYSTVPNEIHSYVKPRLKQEFDLIDASAKVISLLSRITMSNKWARCSPNTYGLNPSLLLPPLRFLLTTACTQRRFLHP